ncbi:ammonium permease mep3 [Pichia californica]|uniref:Ammonium transporter n=1 Tax=Pichia californica TaxID=460514 RepID=A0A9P6WKB1_9ASCO|nr:ammonium permease mep3 [[Candida] californica]KAG0688542.1 ammonium permease mep3 [[Candida] californica]
MEDINTHVWNSANYDSTTILSLILGTCLVLIMCFGLAYLYSGLARRKSALHMIFSVFFILLISIFQWYFWGYSLAFSSTAKNKFIGNLHNFGYQNLENSYLISNNLFIPELAFANFQGMFSSITACIYIGAICERGRILPFIPFTFCWLTLVYCPVTCWIWNSSGWAYKWGVLDYAGGGPVEILSGFSGFVISYFLGQRKEHLMINFRPHNVSMVTIGTMLLWFGWLGFNGLTCINPSLKSVYAIMNSNLCAAFGGFTWVLLDFYRTNHWSTVGLCSGIISGLVAATPTSGVIPLWASIILGIVSGFICNFATIFKVWFKVDDALDVLAEHGIAGVIGLFFNAIFAADYVLGYDGYTVHPGGWINHNWKQMYKQLAYIGAVIGYCMVVTALLCYIIDKLPYCKLRTDEEGEEVGMDENQIGEFAYDYVEVRRNFFDINGFENDNSIDDNININNNNINNNIHQLADSTLNDNDDPTEKV